MSFTRISFVLTKEESERLHVMATQQCRQPRDQARYILRIALLGDSKSGAIDNKSASVKVCETTTGAFAQ